jgi:hypothetical protein
MEGNGRRQRNKQGDRGGNNKVVEFKFYKIEK